ncbi:hypothetical protein [Terrimonas alba]
MKKSKQRFSGNWFAHLFTLPHAILMATIAFGQRPCEIDLDPGYD